MYVRAESLVRSSSSSTKIAISMIDTCLTSICNKLPLRREKHRLLVLAPPDLLQTVMIRYARLMGIICMIPRYDNFVCALLILISIKKPRIGH